MNGPIRKLFEAFALGKPEPVFPEPTVEEDWDRRRDTEQEARGRFPHWITCRGERTRVYARKDVEMELVGRFEQDIVGESHCREALHRIVGWAHPVYGAHVIERA